MIKEEFVTLATAKLLKEAGFPQNPKGRHYNFNPRVVDDWHTEYDWVSMPSQTQAMRWLREERANFISVYPHTNTKFEGNYIAEHIVLSNGFPWTYDYYRGKSYEDATEAGIQAACEYLIKKGGER